MADPSAPVSIPRVSLPGVLLATRNQDRLVTEPTAEPLLKAKLFVSDIIKIIETQKA